jgi:hypothetical protein
LSRIRHISKENKSILPDFSQQVPVGGSQESRRIFFFNKKLSYFTYCQIWLNFLLGGYHTLTNVFSVGDFFFIFQPEKYDFNTYKGLLFQNWP